MDPDVGSATTRSGMGDPWRWVIAGAAVVTVGCAAFAIGAAVSSDDDSNDTVTQPTDGATEPGEPVAIVDFSFDPTGVTVGVGGSVTWTNGDSATHSVVGAGGAFASPDIATGDNFSTTFDQAGTFEYVCGIHPTMTGTVTVEE